jgi:hypothetical protein
VAATPTTPVIGEAPPSPVTLSPGAALKLEQDVVQWCEHLYTTATEDQDYQRECQETMRLIEYVYSDKHWNARSRYSRNRPVLPKAKRHAWETASLLTDLAIDFQIQTYDHFDRHSSFESILNELCTFWALRNDFEESIYDIVMYGLLHTGPAKIQWNSTLNGGMGDVQVVPVAPWQWVALGCGSQIRDAECVIYFPVTTKDHLIRRFGKTAERVECDADFGSALSGNFNRPASISKASWAGMSQTLRRKLGVKSSAGSDDPYPKAILKEAWLTDDSINERSYTVTVGPCDSSGEPSVNWAYRVEPGERLYPRGRVICWAGNCVLEDSPNPYWHSRKPFSLYRPLRLPWQMSGNSALKPWTLMNTTIDKIMGGMLDSLYAINEPTLVAPKGAFPAGDWESLDPGAAGGKIKYNNNSPKAPEFAKRAEFPFAPASQAIDQISKELDMSSGAAAMSQALNKKQVPGGDTLEMILSSRSLPIRLQSRALTGFVEDIGYMGTANILQFYSVAHRVAILGSRGISNSDFRPIYGSVYNTNSGLKPEEFVRKFQFTVKPESTLSSQRDNKIAIALQLRKMGDLSSKSLMEKLDPNFDFEKNRNELIEEARLKLLLGAAGAALTGKGQAKKK